MPTYRWPAPFTGKSTWDAHNRRNPPSSEPGIDLYMPTGTQLVAIADCTVIALGGGIGPATGRFVTVDDGVRWWRFLHNADWGNLWVGKHLKQGEPLCRSGASGYGSEFFGEPSRNAAFWRNTGGDHVHVTAFRGRAYTFGAGGTVDPENLIGPALAGLDSKPFQEDEMNADQEKVLRDIRTTQLEDSEKFRESVFKQITDLQLRVASMHAGSFLPWGGNPKNPGGTLGWLDEKLAATAAAIITALPGGGEIDEAELARQLGPVLGDILGNLLGSIDSLSDEDVQRLAVAAADERDRRERERLDS